MKTISRKYRKAVLTAWALAILSVLATRIEIGAAQTQVQRHQATDRDSVEARERFVPNRVLVRYNRRVGKTQALRYLRAIGASAINEISGTGIYIVDLPEGVSEEAYLNGFRSQSDVEFAELDWLFSPDAMTPDDPSYPSQWHLPKIAAPSAWETTTGSSSVIIAVLDSGVDSSHPDLGSKLVPGWNIIDNNPDTTDVYGHGTAVAGTAAASSNNTTGVASVAWDCKIMPVRVSYTTGQAPSSAIANGLIWAADHGARVANISYKATTSSTVTSGAQYFYNSGGVVAISAGNYATFDSTPDNPYVLTVSGTTADDSLASFSDTGNNVDLCAPASGILTTNRGGGYGNWSGTSFSAPIVAGAAAMVLSANPGLTASEAQYILRQSADDLGSAGWDTSFGAGRVNVSAAVSLATSSTPPPDTTAPTVSISSPSDGATVSGVVTVNVTAGDDTGVTSVTLSVDSAVIGSDTTAPYTFNWDSTTSSNGLHTVSATASDSAGNSSTSSITITVNNVADAPPSVSITSPAQGATVSGRVSVYVTATDDKAVVKVELYVDGKLTSTSTASPFITKWDTRKVKSGAHKLQCKAYDTAGNTAWSQEVTVYK